MSRESGVNNMVFWLCVAWLVYQYFKDKYVQKHGDSYYRNVYLPRKQLEEQQYKQNK